MVERAHIRTHRAETHPRAAAPGWRACALARLARFALLSVLAALWLVPLGASAQAEPVKADITVDLSKGYARIVFRFSDEIDADVRMANNILVISFKTKVSAPVERLPTNAPGYIGAARSDPDGMAVRMALSRKVRINSMMAAERLFVDLLPDSWTAEPPALPQQVVEELARRAREAERKQREQALIQRARQVPLTPVRVAHQPTFSRYVFELPELIGVTTERGKDKLTLVFDRMMKFDLAAAKSPLPPMIESIDSEAGEQTTSVTFLLIGKVDMRSFREDNNFVLDIMTLDNKPSPAELIPRAGPVRALRPSAEADERASGPFAGLEPPQTVPAQPAAPPAAAAAPVAAAAAPTPAPAMAPAVAPVPALPAAALQAPAAETKPPELAAAPAADQPAPQPAATPARPRNPNGPVVVELRRQGESIKLTFPFAAPTPAAVFRRADTLWLVFDTGAKIDVAALTNDPSRKIRGATVTPTNDGQVLRISLARPQLASFAQEGTFWTVNIGDIALEPTRPLGIVRNSAGGTRATAIVPFEDPRTVYRLTDPDVGDTLYVVTALGPARGFLKAQEFVEFNALPSTHGIVIQPLADDVTVELGADKVVVGRPNGLTLSSGGPASRRVAGFRPLMFDSQLWGFDHETGFRERQAKLFDAAASAPENRRTAARLDLARFYLARDMYVEAKGVLDVALGDERPTAEDITGLVMRAVANLMLQRSDEALKDLANPLVGNQHDAQIWRAMAYTQQGKWAEAREAFRGLDVSIGTLPIELQQRVLRVAVRTSIEVRDFGTAATELNEFDQVGVPPDMEASVAVLRGRLAEALGRNDDALQSYRLAGESKSRSSAAQAQLREIALRYRLGDLKADDVITELETLTTVWRGDDTEVEALQILARLYTDEGRYRDAFHVMRTAMKAHPNSEMTRRIQEEAAATFDSLFLAGKGDALPAIEALSLFYDFRELTPIGRRGDEMIRRLTDRLVSVDLLDQAAELLQHQVDHRLQGAARAQVATRLAVIYLMNRKPDRALAAINATRSAELPKEVRNQRLLIEARALSDIGRHDVALDVVSNIEGREAIRLRSDILWAAKRWRESAEQIELMYGDRWRDWRPLNDAERSDLLRAAMGYALGEDKLGIDRFAGRYAAKMAEGPERRAFEVLTSPNGPDSGEFRDIARAVAAVDTLEAFLRDMRARYPETGSFTPVDALRPQSRAPVAAPVTTGSVQARAQAAAR
jgi:tetratricopeptide (TPR) repeat protein